MAASVEAAEAARQDRGAVDDVLIIGAGASGAAAAWLLSSRGLRVTCLEQGGWLRPESYPSDAVDWEYHRVRDFHPNPNVRRLAQDYPIIDDDTPIKPLLYNAVGGSTVLWSGHFPRFHPDDFRVRSLDGVADDWPLDYAELEPYYDRNDAMMGVAGVAGDPAHPPRSPRQLPPVPLGKGGRRLADAFDRLGWHWWPADVAVNTAPYGKGRGVCNNCGPCELGCRLGAKASVDVTYWPAALARGAALVTHARVCEITTDATGRATGARYLDRDGRPHHRRARSLMLAGNAIGTPRLLLLSASSRHPHGLANSSGLVGRNLMHHPIATVTGVFDEPMDGYRGITACSLMSMEFYGTRPDRDFVRGYKLQALRSHGPALTALGGFGLDVPWGAAHHRRFGDVFAHTAALTVTAEDLPDEANRVTLDDVRDDWGIPVPRLTYRVDDNSRRILSHGIGRATAVMEEAGAGEVLVSPLLQQGGFHLMGTARMGEDPERSVVDRWGRAHDVDNLFVVDGSLFVTGAAMNPTSTIQALALRTAEHLAATGPTRPSTSADSGMVHR